MSYYMIRVSIMLFVTNQSNFRDLNCTLEMWKEVTEDASGKFECDYLGKACFSHYVKFASYFLNTDENLLARFCSVS